jgi:streptogramin lyase
MLRGLFHLALFATAAFAGAQVTEYSLGPGPPRGPQQIVLGPDGNLWFPEKDHSFIGRMSPAGVLIAEYGTPTPAAGPEGIVVGPDGALWFTERDAGRVGRLDPAEAAGCAANPSLCTTEIALSAPTAEPVDITVGLDGKIWFTERTGNAIGRRPASRSRARLSRRRHPWSHVSAPWQLSPF